MLCRAIDFITTSHFFPLDIKQPNTSGSHSLLCHRMHQALGRRTVEMPCINVVAFIWLILGWRSRHVCDVICSGQSMGPPVEGYSYEVGDGRREAESVHIS